MPRYTYKCKKCEKVFNMHHMLGDDVENCFLPKCNGEVEKLPPGAVNISKTIEDVSKEVGSLTKETIESTKEEIRQGKEDAGKRMWEGK